MPSKSTHDFISSFYADDTSYASSDNSHSRRTKFAGQPLQETLINLENFCSKWRMGLNASKTKCLLFQRGKSSLTTPNLYLMKEPLKYEDNIKFLGITFDKKLTFEQHINNIHDKCIKRLNLLKTISGRSWGANEETIMYTYRTFIRPVIEYGAVLYAHADEYLLKKLQSIETRAIKIAYDLPPWTTNYWCYQSISFTPILERLKDQAKQFVEKNWNDYVLKEFILNNKPSSEGLHSPIYKAINW